MELSPALSPAAPTGTPDTSANPAGPAGPASSLSSANSTNSANSAIALRLELLGVPVPDHAARSDFDRETDRLVAPILARQRELTRRLANRPCAADRRIQAFLDSYLDGAATRPRLPASTFVLDQPGLARALSLPVNATSFTSDYVESRKVLTGVLHNPRNDRRTTAGVFHVAEGGLPIPDDKKAVPRDVFARILAAAVDAPDDLMTLPWASNQAEPARCFVSLLLRPVVVPEVPGFSAERSMEIRFTPPAAWCPTWTSSRGSSAMAGTPTCRRTTPPWRRSRGPATPAASSSPRT